MPNESIITDANTPKPKFYSLSIVLTLILLPLLCPLTIPAAIFSAKAKKLYKSGQVQLSLNLAEKAKKYIQGAWASSFIILLGLGIVFLISRLSLI